MMIFNDSNPFPVTRWSLVVALVLGSGAAVGVAQEAPPLVGTPDEIVFEWQNPQLVIPPGPRVNQTSPRTATLLAEALARETQVDRKVELLTDLGETQLDGAVDPIRRALRDENPTIRAAAAQAAGLSGRPQLAPDVAALATDADPTARAAAVTAHALLTAGRSDASPAVLAGVKDNDPMVRIAAFAAAQTEPEAVAIAQEVPALRGRLQLAAVEALGRIGSPASVEAVLPLLRETVGQRSAAATALGAMKATNHAAAVTELLKHEHPTVRRSALGAMRGLQSPEEARATAIGMLEDPDPSVRAVAAEMATPVPDARVVATLVKHLADPYMPLHDAALASLGQPAGDAVKGEVITQAVRLLDDPAARRREDGTRLLGVFRSNVAVDKQIALIGQTEKTAAIDGDVVSQTARSLGLIGDPRAVPGIRELARRGVDAIMGDGGDTLAASGAVEALVAAGRFKDAEILPIAKKIMSSNPERTPSEPRGAGAWASGVVGSADDEALIGRLSSLAGSQFDADDTKVEAMKALGRLKVQAAADRVATLAEQMTSPEVRWIGLWAHARITGTPKAYEPPAIPWRAEVAIDDLSDR